MQAKDFSKALRLAWDHKYPQQFRNVIEQLQRDQKSSVTTLLTDLVSEFSTEQLRLAFGMMRDWNTNTQHAEQAQAVLSSIFLCHSPKVGASALTGPFKPCYCSAFLIVCMEYRCLQI